MNAHFELLWKSVFAPRAAVDLAKQHPNISKLMWSYVAAAIVATFICDIFALYILRPYLMTVRESVLMPFPWGDTLLELTVFSVFITIAYVFLLRWFWQGESTKTNALSSIDVAITSGFAWSIAVLLPLYIVAELVFTASDLINIVFGVALLAVYLWYFTVFFSHALEIAMKKSFWRNVSLGVVQILLILVLFIFSAFVSSVMFGIPFSSFFDVKDSAL